MGRRTIAEIKSSCCTTWEHPAARLLLGDHLHPGGRELTEDAIEATSAAAGDVVLDVGCGHGAALRLMHEKGIHAVGLDLSEGALRQASHSGLVVAGDGDHIPLAAGCIDGAVMECVLSLFIDKARALRELKRVLRPRGRLAVSDVVVEDSLPPLLESAAAWSCCLGGALSKREYVGLIASAGFEVIHVRDNSVALMATIEKVRRRLSLFEMSAVVAQVRLNDLGISSEVLERARNIAAVLIGLVRRGALGYVLITAQNPRGPTPSVAAAGAGRQSESP
jgi:arsenite methyltransferase